METRPIKFKHNLNGPRVANGSTTREALATKKKNIEVGLKGFKNITAKNIPNNAGNGTYSVRPPDPAQVMDKGGYPRRAPFGANGDHANNDQGVRETSNGGRSRDEAMLDAGVKVREVDVTAKALFCLRCWRSKYCVFGIVKGREEESSWVKRRI